MATMAVLVFCVLLVAYGQVLGAPSSRILEDTLPANLLTLPSNATSIRSNIEDSFSCEGRSYGYYADVENDCQLFHVCLPVTYASGRSQMFRWSFICPDETVFNQEMFTCTRSDEAIECAQSPRFYNLNANFGEHLSVALPVEDVEEERERDDVAQELDAPPETSVEAADVTQATHVAHAQTTVPIVPIYHRRVMKAK